VKRINLLAISILLFPIILGYFLLKFEHFTWNNPVFHYYYVGLSSLISLGLSIFAYLEYKNTKVTPVYLISLGFLGVSILYFVHGLITPGYSLFRFPDMRIHVNAFVFFGDLSRFWLALLIFIPELALNPITNRYATKKTMVVIAVSLILFSLVTLLNPTFFPNVKDAQGRDTYFSILFKVFTLNILGIEILRYFKLYLIKSNTTILSLTVGNILVFEVVLIFMISKPWGPVWWFAHNLFLLSYLIIGIGILLSYLGKEKLEYFDVLSQVKIYVDKLNKTNKQLNFLANNDVLTKLPNRNYFIKTLNERIKESREQGGHFGLLFVDLDGFKTVNDKYGHHAGDEVLKTTAIRMKDCVNENDIIARLGGDEFVLLVQYVHRNQMVELAKNLINVLTEPIDFGENVCAVGASIGIAIFPNDGQTVDTLIKNSDKAMYHVKAKGKNSYMFYSDF
jgi:diguanylate cyclase (GGDEF)-like protein